MDGWTGTCRVPHNNYARPLSSRVFHTVELLNSTCRDDTDVQYNEPLNVWWGKGKQASLGVLKLERVS